LGSWDIRIADIIEAIENALDYSAGITFEQFAADRKTIDAVVRNLIVIGEAATHLPEDFIAKHPDLPWREMRDMRNIVVHEYFGVDNLIVWKTVQNNLPPLLPQLKFGERIVVTDRKREIAVISPWGDETDELGVMSLIQKGAAEWRGGKPVGLPSRVVSRGGKVSDAVIEGRR
jgi:uncharacterized protein with HEPN domain